METELLLMPRLGKTKPPIWATWGTQIRIANWVSKQPKLATPEGLEVRWGEEVKVNAEQTSSDVAILLALSQRSGQPLLAITLDFLKWLLQYNLTEDTQPGTVLTLGATDKDRNTGPLTFKLLTKNVPFAITDASSGKLLLTTPCAAIAPPSTSPGGCV